jgi:KilA-N domain/Protein of unknown function (DUF3627)
VNWGKIEKMGDGPEEVVQMKEMSLESIVFEKINEQFGWGQYGDFKILIRLSDNYVNATKLCTDGGKLFGHWIVNQKSKDLVDQLGRTYRISDRFSCLSEVTAYGETRGTYVHPDLVPHIASWISAEFAIKVSRIVNEHIVREYQWELNKKQGTINSLEFKVDTLLTELRDARRVIDVTNENVIETLDQLGAVSYERVPIERMAPREKEQLILLHLEGHNYKVIRAQRRAVSGAIATQKLKYPTLRTMLVIDSHPNAKELWNAIKNRLRSDGVEVKVNDVLNNQRGEEYLLDVFQSRNLEKYSVFHSQRERVKSTYQQTREERREPENPKEEEEPNETEEDTPEDKHEARVRELLKLNMEQLKEICRASTTKGWSKLKKMDMVHFIATNEGES